MCLPIHAIPAGAASRSDNGLSGLRANCGSCLYPLPPSRRHFSAVVLCSIRRFSAPTHNQYLVFNAARAAVSQRGRHGPIEVSVPSVRITSLPAAPSQTLRGGCVDPLKCVSAGGRISVRRGIWNVVSGDTVGLSGYRTRSVMDTAVFWVVSSSRQVGRGGVRVCLASGGGGWGCSAVSVVQL